MVNEDMLTPHHGGMLMLKSTTSSLDISFTELLSPHEVKLKNNVYLFFYSMLIFDI